MPGKRGRGLPSWRCWFTIVRARWNLAQAGGSSRRSPSSCSASSGYGVGAPVSGSEPLAIFGNAVICRMSGSPREVRDEAVDAHREAAVRRRAHLQRLEEEAELVALLLLAEAHHAEDGLLHARRRGSGSSRSRAPSRSRSGRSAGRARARDSTRSAPPSPGTGRGERVMHERPAAVSSSRSKSGKSMTQWKTSRLGSIRSSSFARCSRSSPRTRATTASSSATKNAVDALLDAERRELALGEELRDLRQVREPLRAPLLRELLEPRRARSARTSAARRRSARTARS